MSADRTDRAGAEPAADVGEVAISGERGIPSVNRERTVRARIRNAVAVGLVVVITLVAVGGYYAAGFSAQRQAAEAERRAREARAAGDARPPRLVRPEPAVRAPEPSPVPPPVALPAVHIPIAPPPPTAQPALPPAGKSPADAERDRLLSAGVLLRAGGAAGAPAPPTPASAGPEMLLAQAGGAPVMLPGAATAPNSALAQSLRPTPTPAVRAQLLPDRRFLLPKGSFVDCTLETALDSTLPGLATCIAPVDIYSADAKVVLIERGTRFVGETRADVRAGQSRIGVLWNEARTPHGVSVALASPGTDELGRTGLPGHVDRHFWERFGAAILVSMIDGALQAATRASTTTGPVYNTSGSRDVMTEVLRGTIAIPPTVIKNQGERIQIMVARDVDFRSVYMLAPATAPE